MIECVKIKQLANVPVHCQYTQSICLCGDPGTVEGGWGGGRGGGREEGGREGMEGREIGRERREDREREEGR